MNQFDWLSFQHIYRELNTVVDNISKEALQLPKGAFGYYEFTDGEESQALEFQL
jgi:hypothetical protein